ncbi:MAG: hypothetical protein AAGK23_10460 [Pseudomonadota bacterium]
MIVRRAFKALAAIGLAIALKVGVSLIWSGDEAQTPTQSPPSTITSADLIKIDFGAEVPPAAWSRMIAVDILAEYAQPPFDLNVLRAHPPETFSPDTSTLIALGLAEEDRRNTNTAETNQFLAFACNNDQARACRNYGHNLDTAARSRRDQVRAMEYIQKACDLGNDYGCLDLINFKLIHERLTDEDLPDALTRSNAYCNDNFSISCHVYAHVLSRTDQPGPALETACHRGIESACGLFSNTLQQKDNPEATLAAFKAACERGIKFTCFNAGFASMQIGDETTGIAYLEPLCEEGYSNSCYNAAIAYKDRSQSGDGLRSAQMAHKGCSDGDKMACAFYAEKLLNGAGILADIEGSKRVAEPSCQNREPWACEILADYYFRHTQARDYGETVRDLYSFACQSGRLGSCRQLAAVFAGGFGVPRDLPRAMQLLEWTCGENDARSCEELERRRANQLID